MILNLKYIYKNFINQNLNKLINKRKKRGWESSANGHMYIHTNRNELSVKLLSLIFVLSGQIYKYIYYKHSIPQPHTTRSLILEIVCSTAKYAVCQTRRV